MSGEHWQEVALKIAAHRSKSTRLMALQIINLEVSEIGLRVVGECITSVMAGLADIWGIRSVLPMTSSFTFTTAT
jgi:hypothetical protein